MRVMMDFRCFHTALMVRVHLKARFLAAERFILAVLVAQAAGTQVLELGR